jgi:hypothetical protein
LVRGRSSVQSTPAAPKIAEKSGYAASPFGKYRQNETRSDTSNPCKIRQISFNHNYFSINGSCIDVTPNISADAGGIWVASRVDSTNAGLYHDGSLLDSYTQASSAINTNHHTR